MGGFAVFVFLKGIDARFYEEGYEVGGSSLAASDVEWGVHFMGREVFILD